MKASHRPALLGAVSCVVFAVACLAPVVTEAQSVPPPEIDPYAVTGTIAIHGCEVAPADLLVRARPVYPPSPIAPDGAPATAPRSIVVNARAAEDGRFAFLFSGLARDLPYRLGVKLIGESRSRCEKLAWDVAADPLVVAGTTGISIDGYAVSSRLEVLGQAIGERAGATWVSADALDFDDPAAATRTFRWRSLDPEVTGGELQVSTAPFPRGGAGRYAGPCSADESALVFKRDFSAAPGAWTTIEVDFNAVVHGATSGGDGLIPGDAVIGPALTRAGVGPEMLTRLDLGHPLYVRVMPKRQDAIVCDPDRGVPAEAILAKLVLEYAQALGEPQIAVGKISYTPPYIGARPKAGETCYRVTQDHLVEPISLGGTPWDALVDAHMSGVSYGQTATEGKSFCVPNESADDGWFESFVNGFGDVLTGLVDGIGDLVNAAGGMWEKIKAYAVDAVAAGLTVVPLLNCGEGTECRRAIELGIEVGLATMGVPPSLPNFDQLVDQGMDYLAAQAASQLGIPPELADYASEQAQDFMKKAAKDMEDRPYSIPKLPDWLVPYLRFDPAYLTLEISGTGITLPSRPGIIRDNDPVFAGRFVQLPSKLPSPGEKPLLFPMVLEPNTSGLPPAPSKYSDYDAGRWDKARWTEQRYLNGCYHLKLTGLSPVGDHFFPLRDQYFNPQDGTACVPAGQLP